LRTHLSELVQKEKCGGLICKSKFFFFNLQIAMALLALLSHKKNEQKTYEPTGFSFFTQCGY